MTMSSPPWNLRFLRCFPSLSSRVIQATALVEPHSIVITEGLARKIFGNGDPMGKTLSVRRPRSVLRDGRHP